MLDVKIDREVTGSLHEQVASAIRRAIAEGEARPGERLPPARDLARVLGVNSNTVLRALRTLRDEGVLEFRRGRSITVAEGAQLQSRLSRIAREFVKVANREGYTTEEIVALVRLVSENSPARRL